MQGGAYRVLVRHRIARSSDFPKEPTGTGGGPDAGVTSYTAAGVHGQVKEGHRFGITGLCALE